MIWNRFTIKTAGSRQQAAEDLQRGLVQWKGLMSGTVEEDKVDLWRSTGGRHFTSPRFRGRIAEDGGQVVVKGWIRTGLLSLTVELALLVLLIFAGVSEIYSQSWPSFDSVRFIIYGILFLSVILIDRDSCSDLRAFLKDTFPRQGS